MEILLFVTSVMKYLRKNFQRFLAVIIGINQLLINIKSTVGFKTLKFARKLAEIIGFRLPPDRRRSRNLQMRGIFFLTDEEFEIPAVLRQWHGRDARHDEVCNG